MPNPSFRYLTGYDFKPNIDDINRENRMAIRYLAIAGIPVSLAVIAAQTAVRGVPALSGKSFLMLGYFALLLLADRFILPLNCRHTIPLIYLLQAPVLIVAILLGTVWDPTHQALTFLMLMMVMPALILDRPIRVIAVTLFWYALLLHRQGSRHPPGRHHARGGVPVRLGSGELRRPQGPLPGAWAAA